MDKRTKEKRRSRLSSNLACESLYASPPRHDCKGILQIMRHCNELPYPQKIEIPVIITE